MSARLPVRSRLAQAAASGAFWWATGIEDTFIAAPWPATGRTLDEYALTGHYEHWEEDLALVGALGVPAARYGIPWYRVEPEPGRFDFAFAERALARLLELGVDPIVDLVHYGTPGWLEGAFLHPDYPRRVAAYAAAVADRFRGRVHWHTPFNEPRIAAWYCGRLGWWPPYGRSQAAYVRILLAIARGVKETCAVLRAVDPEIVVAHVDATDLYETHDPALASAAALRQEVVFLALDLVTGRVTQEHRLRPWLLAQGVSASEIDVFLESPETLDVLGINLYPMFSLKRMTRAGGKLRVRQIRRGAEILTRLAELYFARYRCPLFVSETAALGSHAGRTAWLRESVEAVRQVRARGLPLIGYTWWPLFALVAWAYRQGGRPLESHLLQMGLYDWHPAHGSARTPTPLVDAYRALAKEGAAAAGALGAAPART